MRLLAEREPQNAYLLSMPLIQRADLNRNVFDYRNEAYLLICAFDKIDDFKVFDPQDVDFFNDLNQEIS